MLTVLMMELGNLRFLNALFESAGWLLIASFVVFSALFFWRGVDRIVSARREAQTDRAMSRLREEEAPLQWDEVHLRVVEDE